MTIFIDRARKLRDQQLAQIEQGSKIIYAQEEGYLGQERNQITLQRLMRSKIGRKLRRKAEKRYQQRLARAFAGQKVRKDPTQFERKQQRTVSTKKGYGY